MKNTSNLRLVLPKKGRLKQDFDKIMLKAGFNVKKENDRQDFAAASDQKSEGMNFEVLFQRPDDALKRIDSGVTNLAIVGTDRFAEMKCAAEQNKQEFKGRIVAEFNGISECELHIAAPTSTSITSVKDLDGCRFATSYPAILRSWLVKNNVKDFSISTCDGGVEDTIRLGEADVICDVVESGKTLIANGLEKKIKLMDSRAILVQYTGETSVENTKLMGQIKDRLIESNFKLQQPVAFKPVTPKKRLAAFV